MERPRELAALRAALRRAPVVALLGARQVGKTTLARSLAASGRGGSFFDLEDARDLARLAEPYAALESLHGLVVLDEIQRRPELFPVLRVLADRPGTPARFLVLGSASPELLRQGSETLAGRVAFHELGGLTLDEVGAERLDRLWLRGGLPRSFLARSSAESAAFRRDYVRTFLERDLGQLGIRVPAPTMLRFWTMLAHHHGQVFQATELGRSLSVTDATVRRWLDALTGALVVRLLQPFFENVGKRQVKSPKLWLSDSGLLHTLLGLEHQADLERHPKLGASWEGFATSEVVRHLGARREECFFWATHAGAELDLLVVRGNTRRGIEVKRTETPRVTPSMRSAMETLKLDSLEVVHAGPATFPMAPDIRAVAMRRILHDMEPLR